MRAERPGAAAAPNLRLELSSRPENLVLVREMLAGVAEHIDLDLDGAHLNDIRTAVTEACNNVVLHAYEGGEGPLEVDVYLTTSALEVLVRDRGMGMPAQVEGDAQEMPAGIGLPVIRALVHRVRFSDAAEHGTEVRMEFATKASRSFKPLEASSIGLLPLTRAELAATMSIAIAPARLNPIRVATTDGRLPINGR